METLIKKQNYYREDVAKRESFLRGLCRVGKNPHQLSSWEEWEKSQRALNLLLEIQGRYEYKVFPEEIKKVKLTKELVTDNGKYSLD